MDLSFSGRTWGKIEIRELQAEAGIGHFRLNFGLELTLYPGEDDGPKHLRLTSIGIKSGQVNARRHLGTAMPGSRSSWTFHPSPHDPRCACVLELDRARIEAMEAMRNGGALPCEICYEFQVRREGDMEWRPETLSDSYEIPQSRWLELLRDMGYRDAFLVEIPRPTLGDLHIAVGQAFREMEAAFRRGDNDSTARLARDVLDALPDEGPPSSDFLQGKKKKERTLEERYLLVRRFLQDVTHLANHNDPLAQDTHWSREMAQFIFTSTAALAAIEMARKPQLKSSETTL